MLKHILLLAHIRAYYFSERQGRRKDSIQTFFFLFLIYNAECPWIKIENQECELEFKEFLGTVLEAERFLQVSFIPLCLFIFPKRIFLSLSHQGVLLECQDSLFTEPEGIEWGMQRFQHGWGHWGRL